jgi:hypothetical protein
MAAAFGHLGQDASADVVSCGVVVSCVLLKNT